MFKELYSKSLQYFPNLTIAYKDQSPLMRFLGKLLFFNPQFSNFYTTTIGNTIYYPSQSFIDEMEGSSSIVLLHELVHVYDSQRLGRLLFSFLYLTPQILSPLFILLFLLSWKIALPLLIIFASPLPSYFRMLFERRAYLAELYVIKKMNDKGIYSINLNDQKNIMISQYFSGSYYYFMWPIPNQEQVFTDAIAKIQAGARPYEDKLFDMLDDILSVI
jgi:hypothetical protein